MSLLAAERKALLFTVGGVRLAIRVAQVREILEVGPGGGDVVARGASYPVAFVATVLGLRGGDAPFALLTETVPRAALRVEKVLGIVDLVDAEVFQIPARTRLPQPAPFAGAIVHRGLLALELATPAIGWEPLQPASDPDEPPADVGPSGEPELVFTRGGARYGVAMSYVTRIVEQPVVAPVPLAPPSHLGLLYEARTLHPVIDVAGLHGEPVSAIAPRVVLIDAGGTEVALAADRVERVRAAPEPEGVRRPAWDLFLGG